MASFTSPASGPTSLDAQQDLLRRALAILEAGHSHDPRIPDDIARIVTNARIANLNFALVDHEEEGCSAVGRECSSVEIARKVITEHEQAS